MVYRPSASPPVSEDDSRAIAAWVEEELEAIRLDQSETTALDLRPIFAAPVRPRDGLIIHADGTQFDPGAGAGPYSYINGIWVPLRGRETLLANRTYFVNSSTGSDSNNGRTSGTAFLTLQKAINTFIQLDLNGFAGTISVANGTYAGFTLSTPFVGGLVTVIGNTATPTSVVVNSNVLVSNGAVIELRGLQLTSIQSFSNGIIRLRVNNRTVGPGVQMYALNNGQINMDFTPHTYAGTASYVHLAEVGGQIVSRGASATVVGSIFFDFWAVCVRNGIYWPQGTTGFAGVTGSGGARYKFSVNTAGGVSTGGAGVNFPPGLPNLFSLISPGWFE